jgi:hypothetical protein
MSFENVRMLKLPVDDVWKVQNQDKYLSRIHVGIVIAVFPIYWRLMD